MSVMGSRRIKVSTSPAPNRCVALELSQRVGFDSRPHNKEAVASGERLAGSPPNSAVARMIRVLDRTKEKPFPVLRYSEAPGWMSVGSR
jgi:hypothetical protein